MSQIFYFKLMKVRVDPAGIVHFQERRTGAPDPERSCTPSAARLVKLYSQ